MLQLQDICLVMSGCGVHTVDPQIQVLQFMLNFVALIAYGEIDLHPTPLWRISQMLQQLKMHDMFLFSTRNLQVKITYLLTWPELGQLDALLSGVYIRPQDIHAWWHTTQWMHQHNIYHSNYTVHTNAVMAGTIQPRGIMIQNCVRSWNDWKSHTHHGLSDKQVQKSWWNWHVRRVFRCEYACSTEWSFNRRLCWYAYTSPCVRLTATSY